MRTQNWYSHEEVKAAVVACKLLQSAGLLPNSLGINSFSMRVTDYLTGEWAKHETGDKWKELHACVKQVLRRS